ncbi:unnamed protein product [Allacma fusca]|uniref:ER-bound oxygenase mpaB/mpaB'/Rubber oxygenase catalytic domain-containing protein n=1 Tax=Allacma fusca TaxID=39272 RepID=A0A8J2JWY0_9HEXA|nr:unnamed protein product [Allacma fusca]
MSKVGNCARLTDQAQEECLRPNKLQKISITDVLKLGETLPLDSRTTSLFPCWFDLELARTGQRFARKYLAQISFANGMSLILLLSDYQTRRVLFLTQKSETPEKAFKRYTATMQQIVVWFESDILSPNWVRSVTNVRKIHSHASSHVKSLNSTASKFTVTPEENETGFQPNGNLWKAFKMDLAQMRYEVQPTEFDYSTPKFKFNQYTMVMTVWAFMALPILSPQALGIKNAMEEELQGYAHLWAVIAYALGTDEKFIFCKGTLIEWQDCKCQLKDLLTKHFLPQLLNLDFEGELMIESMLLAFKRILTGYPVEGLLINLLEEHLGMKATHLRKQRDLMSLVAGTTVNNFIYYSGYNPVLGLFTNQLTLSQIQSASLKVFGDPGTNLTHVSNAHFYF